MTTPQPVPEPSRATEIARLELAQLPAGEPLDAVFRRACELAANALAVERVGVWLFIDDHALFHCANLFELSTGEHSAGLRLRVADFPTFFASLSIRKAIPAEVAGVEPWAAELVEQYLRPLGITSMLDAGIFVNGELAGAVCHEHIGEPREWTTEDRDFAGSVADLLALRIQTAEVRELCAAFLTQEGRAASAEKAAALELFAAGVAHDFRNLLSVVLGHGSLISGRPDVPPEVRKEGEKIIATAQRGAALAQELMDFARPPGGPPAVLDLAAATAEFLPVLKAAIGSRCELDYTPPALLDRVLIEKGQFTRLLLNLVVNAAEATPAGGRVHIRLARVKPAVEPGTSVLLEVSDTGSGIDEVTLRHLFEPFFTTKSRGSGLGLAIVRQVVDRAGGTIRVESAPDSGTTFRVYFPRVTARPGTPPAPPGSA